MKSELRKAQIDGENERASLVRHSLITEVPAIGISQPDSSFILNAFSTVLRA